MAEIIRCSNPFYSCQICRVNWSEPPALNLFVAFTAILYSLFKIHYLVARGVPWINEDVLLRLICYINADTQYGNLPIFVLSRSDPIQRKYVLDMQNDFFKFVLLIPRFIPLLWGVILPTVCVVFAISIILHYHFQCRGHSEIIHRTRLFISPGI